MNILCSCSHIHSAKTVALLLVYFVIHLHTYVNILTPANYLNFALISHEAWVTGSTIDLTLKHMSKQLFVLHLTINVKHWSGDTGLLGSLKLVYNFLIPLKTKCNGCYECAHMIHVKASEMFNT